MISRKNLSSFDVEYAAVIFNFEYAPVVYDVEYASVVFDVDYAPVVFDVVLLLSLICCICTCRL